ncbi:MAG: LLM class F420-dependent oxidoreductase [Actinomycetota bacterium]
MKLGLQIPTFTWPGGAAELAPTLAAIARGAESAGYDSLWVMDHFFQINMVGAPEEPMLEAYTTLGYLAALTTKVGLGTLVTGVTYRHPGLLAKIVTTLDVLSGGRAWLGIGAAWNQEEHLGLGVPFPPVHERFELLEDALGICLKMFAGHDGPFDGLHAHLGRTLNQPLPLSQPHPRILIGGSGERKTLRLVARHADACNLFAGPAELPHKLEVLRRHCDTEGRDYDAILKTVYYGMDVGENGSRVSQVVDELGALAEAGAQKAIGYLRDAHRLVPLEIVGREVIPAIAAL